jgi:MazG family protein
MTLGEKFERLVAIMTRLRSETGCIWDRQQTHASLRQYLLEEAYEVLEAIDHEDFDELGKELGDLLLQVVFHAQIAREHSRFDIATVIENISEKMIRRHPHVFGEEKVASVAEQKLRWEELKKEEGKKSAIDGVPKALPALQRAARLQQKANLPAMTRAALQEDWERFLAATEPRESLQRAYGDLLFALVAFGRGAELNAEDALREACERFIQDVREAERPSSE